MVLRKRLDPWPPVFLEVNLLRSNASIFSLKLAAGLRKTPLPGRKRNLRDILTNVQNYKDLLLERLWHM